MMKEFISADWEAIEEYAQKAFCETCDLSSFEADVNYWSCPCSYSFTDSQCPHSDIAAEIEEKVDRFNKELNEWLAV